MLLSPILAAWLNGMFNKLAINLQACALLVSLLVISITFAAVNVTVAQELKRVCNAHRISYLNFGVNALVKHLF